MKSLLTILALLCTAPAWFNPPLLPVCEGEPLPPADVYVGWLAEARVECMGRLNYRERDFCAGLDRRAK